jgi:hypothetical protein
MKSKEFLEKIGEHIPTDGDKENFKYVIEYINEVEENDPDLEIYEGLLHYCTYAVIKLILEKDDFYKKFTPETINNFILSLSASFRKYIITYFHEFTCDNKDLKDPVAEFCSKFVESYEKNI